MRFPENDIVYMQDHSFHRGVPTGIDFAVNPCCDGDIKLTAPGYGVLDVPDQYGNGALFIRAKCFWDFFNRQVDTLTADEVESILDGNSAFLDKRHAECDRIEEENKRLREHIAELEDEVFDLRLGLE